MKKTAEVMSLIKKMIFVLVLLGLILGTAGCKFSIEKVDMPQLPTLDLRSSLIGTVQSISGLQCLILVTEGNSSYDEDTVVHIRYQELPDNQKLAVGTSVSITYDYVTDVTSINRYEMNGVTYRDLPHINVQEITVLPSEDSTT